MTDKPAKVSLMFLSPTDQALIWKAVKEGQIPYPINGMVSALFADWLPRDRSLYGSALQSGAWDNQGDFMENRGCRCVKPYGGPVQKCYYCRFNESTTTPAIEMGKKVHEAVFGTCRVADLLKDKRELHPVSGIEAFEDKPVQEFRRWKCDNPECKENNPKKYTFSSSFVGDKHQVCCVCKTGTATVIACDEQGRELQ